MIKKYCEYCGASLNEHKHSLSKALVQGLIKLSETENPINIKELNLTRNQWDNFQKLRYWDLVSKHQTPEGKRVGGTWFITDRGTRFLNGNLAVSKSVWTYRGERVRFEGDGIEVTDVIEGYRHRRDYAEDMTAHEDA